MNYSAYLRVYEPLSAFHEPHRSRWVAYAASSTRPRRRDALTAEHAEGLRWLVTRPEETVPTEESEHAYVRSADGVVYICPWETRLRSLVAIASNASDLPVSVPWINRARPHIRSSQWTMPLAWFVPFAGAERWVALGHGSRDRRDVPAASLAEGDDPADPSEFHAIAPEAGGSGEATPREDTAAQTRMGSAHGSPVPAHAASAPPQVGRTLVYVTQMSSARRRVARGRATLRRLAELTARDASRGGRERTSRSPGCAGPERTSRPDEAVMAASAVSPWARNSLDDTQRELATVGRWLEEFHPCSLVELDYGGLVRLFTDEALCGDESVAELAAAIDAMSRGHCELAIAMLSRAQARWRAFREFEQVN